MSRIHTLTIGSTEIIVITDGEFQFGAELFPGTDESHINDLLKASGANSIDTNFNAFVVKSPGRTMLVDAGPRDLFGDTCGKLPVGLSEAGIAIEDITHVMLTHMHPDHIAGAVSADGQAVFKNASLLINDVEHDFWSRDEAFGDENMDQWQQVAKQVIAAYGDNLELFKAGADLGLGVTAVALPGHTPGHGGFRVDDGTSSFIMACDIVHAQSLQLADPNISIVFDVDEEAARETRKKTLDMIATDGIVFSGGHLISPKVGELVKSGMGYALENL